MVETAIYVLLGALASALLALLALPAVSRRAFRLARRRADLTAPLSAAEARAERDALRGRHAVDLAQVDRRAAKAQENWAAAQIALGQRATELIQRDETLAEKSREIARQRQELATLSEELRAREAEIGAREVAIRDALDQRDAAQRRLSAVDAQLDVSRARAEEEHSRRDKLERQFAALTLELDAERPISPLTLPKAQMLDLFPATIPSEAIDAIHDRLADAAIRENDLGLRVKALAAARFEAEAALRGATRERDAALRDLAEARDADAELRQAIVRLGRDIVERHRPEPVQTYVSQS